MVEKEAAQVNDRSESPALQSGDNKLVDMQAFKDAVQLAKSTSLDAQQKSEGIIRSNTLDGFPKFQLKDGALDTSRAQAVQMPQVGGDDTSVKMPQLGGNDTSIKMPGTEPFQNSDFLSFDAINTRAVTDFLRVDDMDTRAVVTDFLKKTIDEPRDPMSPVPIALEAGMEPVRRDQKVIRTEKGSEEGSVKYTYKDGVMETKYPDGRVLVEHPDKSGFLLRPTGERTIWTSRGSIENYDKDSNLINRIARMPDGSQLATDGSGRVIGVVSGDMNHHASFEYDAKGDLTKITGTLGVWTRETDADGVVYWQNQNDASDRFDGDLRVDSDGNIHATPNDRNADKHVIMRSGEERTGYDAETGLVKETVDEKGNKTRNVYDEKGNLRSQSVTDEKGVHRVDYDENGNLVKKSTYNKLDGSREEIEYNAKGRRTNIARVDAKGNSENVICDPDTGREVASDIKFKDGSNMHVDFDSDGQVKALSSKDASGNIRKWDRDDEGWGASSEDVYDLGPNKTEKSRTVVTFADGFKVEFDFTPLTNNISTIWTSDRQVKGVRKPTIASIKR